MIWLLYNVLFAAGFALMLPHFLLRMWRRGGYAADFGQRLGRYAPDVRARLATGGRVWIHAVSVGELFVALKVMAEWRKRRPGTHFLISTTTSTGYALARRHVVSPDVFIYFPADFPAVARRVIKLIRPSALVLVELELWPNLVRFAHARAIPVMLVNGRVSDRSFRGYRRLRLFTRRVLRMVNPICAQSAQDAERLVLLGASPDHVHVAGSAKYDVAELDPSGEEKALDVLRMAGISQGQPIILGGSTWEGEEAALLEAFVQLRKRHAWLSLVLAPRHVERCDQVAEEIHRRGLSLVRRKQLHTLHGSKADVLLIDTTGELKNFYSHASVIFIGKSLTQHGGQNPIEAALYGRPIVVGPNMENFHAVMQDFRQADALVQIEGPAALAPALGRLLDEPAEASRMGARAAGVVQGQSGAVARTLDLVDEVLGRTL